MILSKKWKNISNQQQQNCAQFIQFVQSTFVEIVGNEENDSTEINIQLAPLQATVGDLLFIVVTVANPFILMTPGAEEIDMTPRLAPLVIPVLVGSNNNSNGPRSPRK